MLAIALGSRELSPAVEASDSDNECDAAPNAMLGTSDRHLDRSCGAAARRRGIRAYHPRRYCELRGLHLWFSTTSLTGTILYSPTTVYRYWLAIESHAATPDPRYCPGPFDVAGRIAIDEKQIGSEPRFDATAIKKAKSSCG